MSDVDVSCREYAVQGAVQSFQRHHLARRPYYDPDIAVDAAVGTALFLWAGRGTPADVVVAVYRAVQAEADLIRAVLRVEHCTVVARRRFAELDRQDAAVLDARPVAGDRS